MQFDFQLAPGASQTIDVKGRFFKYKSGNGLIRVRTSLGGAVDLLPGQGVENVNFTSLTIADRSGATNAGSILAGDFDFRDDRITGTVEVLDGGKARTLAGQTFMQAISVGGVAAKNTFAQLWNPAGSGRRLVVKSVFCSLTGPGAAGGFVLSFGQSQAGTLIAKCASKRPGGALSNAEARSETAVLPGIVTGQSMYREAGPAGARLGRVFDEPLVIGEGFGMLAYTVDLEAGIVANVEFIEELI